MNQTEEIKAKLDIVDIISEYIQLKQAGTNFKGLCPFHNEKTPSFMVSREKQIWHCFGCGEGGDAFSFVQKIDSLDFPEALKLLAQKAGVTLKKQDPKIASQKSKLLEITRLSAEYFHKALLDSKEGQIARDYIDKRKLSPSTVDDFKLGYAPDSWDRLLNFLIKKGHTTSDILLAGLIVKNEKGKTYDRFRQRLMFPIFDQNGTIVGFTARVLDDAKANQGGKYINTPQSLIYNKSLVIFGLDKAKKQIKENDLTVIVEGNMDVIASHQAGINNVIASSGTALTLEQLKFLDRYSPNLAIAFDADLAGQAAAERGIETALSIGMNVKIIQMPEEINGQTIKDPDDLLNQGVEHWQKAIDSAISFLDYHFNKQFKTFDKNDPLQKKEIAAKLLKQIAKLNDSVEQEHWLKLLAQKLDVSESVLRENIDQYLERKNTQNNDIKFEDTKLKNREHLLAEQLLALIFKFPENLEYLINHLDLEAINEPSLYNIYKQLILYYNKVNNFDYSEFEKILNNLDSNLVNNSSALLLLADKDFSDFKQADVKKEIINILKQIKKNYISKKIKQVEGLLKQAENNNDKVQIDELTKDFSILTQELNQL